MPIALPITRFRETVSDNSSGERDVILSLVSLSPTILNIQDQVLANLICSRATIDSWYGTGTVFAVNLLEEGKFGEWTSADTLKVLAHNYYIETEYDYLIDESPPRIPIKEQSLSATFRVDDTPRTLPTYSEIELEPN